MTKTYVHIDNLKVHAYHGVLPQERVVGNDYYINIKVGTDWIRATETDNVNDTLDYSKLAMLVQCEMAEQSNLIEHVAGRIINNITTNFENVSSINLRITKVAPPMSADCDGAGVEIEYHKNKD